MNLSEAIKIFEDGLKMRELIPHLVPAYETAISAMKELHMYKDNKLCLIPEDVYGKQCDELDGYKKHGTLEEVREAVEKRKEERPINVLGIYGEKEHICKDCGNNLIYLIEYCGCCGKRQDWSDEE